MKEQFLRVIFFPSLDFSTKLHKTVTHFLEESTSVLFFFPIVLWHHNLHPIVGSIYPLMLFFLLTLPPDLSPRVYLHPGVSFGFQ